MNSQPNEDYSSPQWQAYLAELAEAHKSIHLEGATLGPLLSNEETRKEWAAWFLRPAGNTGERYKKSVCAEHLASLETKVARQPMQFKWAGSLGKGTFAGLLSTWESIDEYGDVVKRGAFAKSLLVLEAQRKQRGGAFLLPLLWSHQMQRPIGGFTSLSETSEGLSYVAALDLDIDDGQRAYSALSKGYVNATSMGFLPVKVSYGTQDGEQVRYLLECELVEGSLVTLPANPQALVTTVY